MRSHPPKMLSPDNYQYRAPSMGLKKVMKPRTYLKFDIILWNIFLRWWFTKGHVGLSTSTHLICGMADNWCIELEERNKIRTDRICNWRPWEHFPVINIRSSSSTWIQLAKFSHRYYVVSATHNISACLTMRKMPTARPIYPRESVWVYLTAHGENKLILQRCSIYQNSRNLAEQNTSRQQSKYWQLTNGSWCWWEYHWAFWRKFDYQNVSWWDSPTNGCISQWCCSNPQSEGKGYPDGLRH